MSRTGGDPRTRPGERGSEEPAGSTRPRRRGRPARLSRARILDAVLSILEREPDQVPTIARIAREVEAVPAALYRHFESLDDIFDGVLARVLEAGPTGLDDQASWQVQLACWMRELRDLLLRYPAVLAMLGRTGRTSPAWLDASSALIEILLRAGLAGHELAVTYLWILETTVGLVLQEAAQPIPEQIENARASGHELDDIARARFAPLVPAFARIDGDEFFSFAVDQATAVVELRLEAVRRAPGSTRRP